MLKLNFIFIILIIFSCKNVQKESEVLIDSQKKQYFNETLSSMNCEEKKALAYWFINEYGIYVLNNNCSVCDDKYLNEKIHLYKSMNIVSKPIMFDLLLYIDSLDKYIYYDTCFTSIMKKEIAKGYSSFETYNLALKRRIDSILILKYPQDSNYILHYKIGVR